MITGGYSVDWKNYIVDVGYPIGGDAAFIITKPEKNGGAVNRRTVIEQLVTKPATHGIT